MTLVPLPSELLTEVQGAIKALMPRMQLVLELSGEPEKGKRGGR